MFESILQAGKMPKYSPLRASAHGSSKEKAPDPSSSCEASDEEEPFMRSLKGSHLSKPSWIRRHWRSILVHSTVSIVNILFFVVSTTGLVRSNDLQHATGPFKNTIRYHPQKFELHSTFKNDGTLNPQKPNNFNGPPRLELEEAWNHLQENDSIRVTLSELGQFATDDTIIQLNDDKGGYYTTVSVYHGLHCIERLHHYIYSDHYYPNLTQNEQFILKRHTEHCLDWLRHNPKPAALDWGNHQCVVWEDIENWMAERAFDPYEPGVLMHPRFGTK
ncbi:hypothetical protein QBC40DRAFT_292781 [Triangularia verruculosa]|uniref:Tat pathway signal sequence n=1 Tax=Triangularia verruculosa TaxID=2587418 RepID=A0AAN6XVT0_9PEZI|nr:hypothetical protein QBC40DRAFT_292781 [Triangularia verruculosa]